MQTIDNIDQLSLKDRLPLLYLEHGKLSFSEYGFTFFNNLGKVLIPVCSITTLLIGPGVSVTSDFVANSAKNNVLLLWVGEGCTKIYSTGMASVTACTERVLKQSFIITNWEERIAHLTRLYQCMFPGLQIPQYNTLDHYRGWEGSKVRGKYKEIAEQYGIDWKSRREAEHDLQVVLNVSNGCLYALVEAVTLSCGLHSALGIIHQGDQRSLVYDIADTVKFNWFLPRVFGFYKEGASDPFRDSRKFCRELFINSNLTKKLFDNVKYIYQL